MFLHASRQSRGCVINGRRFISYLPGEWQVFIQSTPHRLALSVGSSAKRECRASTRFRERSGSTSGRPEHNKNDTQRVIQWQLSE
jgi:hypothetical protein